MAMSNSDLIDYYRKELRRSKNWRHNKEQNYDDAWRRYIDMYRGDHYDVKNNVDQLTVNLIFSTINVMAPAVAINNPRFVVNSRKPETQPQAILVEEVLNYLWRTHDYQRDFRLSVLDFLLVGHGWIKVGYKATKPPEPKKTEGDPTLASNTDTTESAANEEGIDDREDIPGNVESEMYIYDDRPFVERISPFDVFVDPDARHPKEMCWIAQRVWRPVQDVQVDDRYSATQRKRVSASTWSKWDSEDGGDARSSDERPDRGSRGYCEVIEFYDLKRKTVQTFAADGSVQEGDPDSGFLIKPEAMPYALGCPFVMLRNYEVPDHFYPIGDVQQIESLQLELNETRNQMLNYRKKFRRAWIYKRDAFDREGVQALESEQDNVMIPVADVNEQLEGVLSPVPTVITPPEFFDQSAMISMDMDRVSGVSDYQRGAQAEIKRTATEAAMIQDAANARAQDRLAKIEHVLADVGEHVVALMQQFLTGQHVARIVTIPVDGWINYDLQHIQGQFDFEVVGGSTEPQNETFRRQSALQLADVSVPFMEAGVVNEAAVYQEILRNGFGKKDAARFVQMPPPPPEMQQQMPMDEMGPGGGGPPPGGPGGGQPMPVPPQGAMEMGMPPPDQGMGAQQLTPEDFAMMMMQQGGMPQ